MPQNRAFFKGQPAVSQNQVKAMPLFPSKMALFVRQEKFIIIFVLRPRVYVRVSGCILISEHFSIITQNINLPLTRMAPSSTSSPGCTRAFPLRTSTLVINPGREAVRSLASVCPPVSSCTSVSIFSRTRIISLVPFTSAETQIISGNSSVS